MTDRSRPTPGHGYLPPRRKPVAPARDAPPPARDPDDPVAQAQTPAGRAARVSEERDTKFLVRCVQASLIFFGVAVALFVFWHALTGFLMGFAAVVIATIFVSVAMPLEHRLRMRHGFALAIAIVVIFAVLGCLIWLLVPNVQGQLPNLLDILGRSSRQLADKLGVRLPNVTETAANAGAASGAAVSAGFGLIGTVFSATRTAVTIGAGTIVVIFTGIFLASAPGMYRDGIVMLFPVGQHTHIREALHMAGIALRRWLLTTVIAMAMVGTMAGVGTWGLGLPAPLSLGVFAGLVEFVPFFGSVGGAIPAVIVAFGQGGNLWLWTILLFIGIQQLESNVIIPVLQQEMVTVPAALLMISIIILGFLFGILGIIIATPLTIVLFILVKQLYVRDTLQLETEMPEEI